MEIVRDPRPVRLQQGQKEMLTKHVAQSPQDATTHHHHHPKDKDSVLACHPGSPVGNRPGAIGLRHSGLTRRLDGHPHLVGAHAARLVQVKLPEDGLEQGAEGEGRAEGGTQPFPPRPGWGLDEGAGERRERWARGWIWRGGVGRGPAWDQGHSRGRAPAGLRGHPPGNSGFGSTGC